MIVKDGELTLRKTLAPLLPFIDELVVSIDARSTDRTAQVLAQVEADFPLWPVVTVIDGPAALEVGFDAARNLTLENANGDWFLWLDADEEVVRGNVLGKYLRPNCFNGYAIKQHHFAVEPAGILATDLPSRLFRRDIGARFLGCVHEHPELGDNEGIGPAMLIQDVHLVHTGYYTEDIRRGRFMRNIDLMYRDRKTNPKRRLGKFLWIRDLAHMCQFTLEQTNGVVTEQVRGWSFEALATFQQLLEDGDLRLIVDSLGYYSTCVKMLGGGVDVALRLDMQRETQAESMRAGEVRATFADRTHAERVLALIAKTELDKFDTKYW
jgi:glycosyltransferase involved in cell wall biosynthesis